jgi:beta-glucanase (GH16 family)
MPMGPGKHRRRLRWAAPIAITVGVVLVLVAGIAIANLNSLQNAADRPTTEAGAQPGTEGSSDAPSAEPSATSSAIATASPTPLASPTSACAFTISGGVCPIAPPVAAAAGKRWKISLAEEFSGNSYDRSKLTPCFDWNGGDCTSTFNNGREHYQPSQVVVSNGTAKLIAAPLNPPFASKSCQNGSCTYKAGLLSTARAKANSGPYLFSFTYGYVESRFKFPATQGFFTAFWMLPADRTYTYRSEIDILEMLGDDPTTMFMTYHYNNRSESYHVNAGKFKNGACATKDYSKQFVRMGLDWQPDHIAWYIDGVKCAEFKNAAQIENGPMQLLIHMMVDNDWQRRWNVGLADPTLTRQLEVDYIRVYQQS